MRAVRLFVLLLLVAPVWFFASLAGAAVPVADWPARVEGFVSSVEVGR